LLVRGKSCTTAFLRRKSGSKSITCSTGLRLSFPVNRAWRIHAWFPHVCDLPKGRFRQSTLAAELQMERLDSPLGSPIADVRNQMSAPPNCAEHVRRRVPTVRAFLIVGSSCVCEATVNSKPRINRGCHPPTLDALLNPHHYPYFLLDAERDRAG
jgi:hypothetical protein